MVRMTLASLVLISLGCSPSVGEDTDGASSTGTTSGDPCAVGQVACECTEGGGCDPGLMCVVGVCIPEDASSGPSTDVDTIDPDSGTSISATTESTGGSSSSAGTTDASTSAADESSSGGVPLTCGDGRLDADEICDDGNNVTGDGCNADCVPGGQELWTVVLDGGLQHDDYGRRVAIDADGDIYVSGYGSGMAANDSDGLLAKYDDDGQLQWLDRGDGGIGVSNDGYWGVAVSSDQTVVVSGWQSILTNQIQATVRKYSADGDVLWTYVEPDIGDGQACDVSINSLDEIVVTGLAHDPMDGSMRTWLAKLSADGDVIWNQRLEVPSGGYTFAVEVDSSDAIVISRADGVAYVRKLDADGLEIWTWSSALGGNTGIWGLDIDADDGIFVAGNNATQTQTLFAHYLPDGGDPDWSDGWVGSYGWAALGYDVAVDGAGRTVWAGHQASNLGDQAMFVRKLDLDHGAVWTDDIEGIPAGNDIAFGVAIDADDQPVVVGTQRDDDFDDDIWIRKYTP